MLRNGVIFCRNENFITFCIVKEMMIEIIEIR